MKKGDKVVYCGDMRVLLTLNNLYEVLDISANDAFINIIDNNGELNWFVGRRFKLLSEVRKEKLLKLSEYCF